MAIRAFFPTLVYRAALEGARGAAGFNRTLADECQALAASDVAGKRWSARNYLGGYTSYGSHDRLHLVSSVFAALRKRIDPHVRAYVRRLHYDLGGRRLAMTDCWLNVMPAGVGDQWHVLCRRAAGCRRAQARGPAPVAPDGVAAQARRRAPPAARPCQPARAGRRSDTVRELAASRGAAGAF